MRIGIIALLQESNTFIGQATTLAHFEQELLATGEAVRERLAGTHHEVAGMFHALDEAGEQAVPIFAARAMPFGVIETAAIEALFSRMFAELDKTLAAGKLDGLLVAPVPRESIFLGKLLANLAFVGTIELVTLPLFTLFFNVSLWAVLPGVLGVAALATVGFVAVGTIFSAMAVRTRFAELMLPVLLLPFMVPPLIGAVQVTTRLLAGRPLSEMLGWLRLLALYDVVFVTLCTLIFSAVVDE